MVTLLVVNDKDMTPYINGDSYKVNSKDQYESWQDGNFVEHRVIVRKRIEGSFELFLYGYNGMTYQTFLQNWTAAENNGVVTMGVWVQDLNMFKAIQAYYDFTGTKHKELINGNMLDRITVSIKEK